MPTFTLLVVSFASEDILWMMEPLAAEMIFNISLYDTDIKAQGEANNRVVVVLKYPWVFALKQELVIPLNFDGN